ncbi:MAG: hypothetical protein ABW215_23955 [Kibdelosporangium sp.]
MRENRRESALERVVPGLFALLVVLGLLRLLLDGSPAWWSTTWNVASLAFFILVLYYLGVAGTGKVLDGGRPHTLAGWSGMVGLVLLAAAVLVNAVTAMSDTESPGWQLARNAVLTGFAVCFVLHVAARYRQRRRHHVSESHHG